ncbi:hypothetical protein PG985_009802 [Apiospora marii]|uniref:uncharacterized protein n=1 Tax=Apiospora marii TaxID=335849 RepID=UPI0031321BBD
MGSLANLQTWQEKVSWARARRDASLAKVEPRLNGIPEADHLPLSSQDLPKAALTAREIEITEQYGITELLGLLRERKVTVEEVTRAFLRRAALAQAATNCLTELLWDQAIERAKHLDSLPEPRGALFGLPISTKEHHGMVGANVTTSASFVAWVGKAHSGPNLLYDTFWNEGCVFFARTTQPQTIMHLETESNVYGRTVNPYNRDLTSGGSSGGESALLGMRGSILGVGGDIGGSIRCPAAHVGIYGFKSAEHQTRRHRWLPERRGRQRDHPGLPGPHDGGPRRAGALHEGGAGGEALAPGAVAHRQGVDPYKFTKPLKIAVQWWDGVVQPHPPMMRALREVADACRKAGMEVVDWDCEQLDHRKAWDIISALYWPDGGKEVLGLIKESGEPILPLTKFIIEEQPTVKELTQHELWKESEPQCLISLLPFVLTFSKLCVERDEYRARYAQAWSKTGNEGHREVDVILCPPSFGAATPHGQSRYWGYTAQWNLLDYPAAVFPVTTVDPTHDAKDLDYAPKNDQDRFVYDVYSPERFSNAPVSLQVVGRRQEEEKVLAALAEIERAMGRK